MLALFSPSLCRERAGVGVIVRTGAGLFPSP